MLYLVATPIGNLGDISRRAEEVLRAVDVVASEDTRRTRALLTHLGISKPLLSFHEHNEQRMTGQLVNLLAEGKEVALVTDAGTPGIADPGYRLVQAAVAAAAPLTMIPGPAAFVMALVLSGLPVHSFTFRGFPPRKGGPRRTFLAVDAAAPHTLIYYESPYRIRALVDDALLVLGDRPAALANDLTKKFERIDRASLSELAVHLAGHEPRGEYVLVVQGASVRRKAESGDERVNAVVFAPNEYDETDDEADVG